jgi:hypothetical protein
VRRDVDTLRVQLEEERGTAGRILYDDAILRELQQLRDRLDRDSIETTPSTSGKP